MCSDQYKSNINQKQCASCLFLKDNSLFELSISTYLLTCDRFDKSKKTQGCVNPVVKCCVIKKSKI